MATLQQSLCPICNMYGNMGLSLSNRLTKPMTRGNLPLLQAIATGHYHSFFSTLLWHHYYSPLYPIMIPLQCTTVLHSCTCIIMEPLPQSLHPITVYGTITTVSVPIIMAPLPQYLCPLLWHHYYSFCTPLRLYYGTITTVSVLYPIITTTIDYSLCAPLL